MKGDKVRYMKTKYIEKNSVMRSAVWSESAKEKWRWFGRSE